MSGWIAAKGVKICGCCNRRTYFVNRRTGCRSDPSRKNYFIRFQSLGTARRSERCVIVTDSDLPSYRRAVPVYRALRGIGIPVDVVVQTREEVERSRNVRSSLAWKVMEEGKVIYG